MGLQAMSFTSSARWRTDLRNLTVQFSPKSTLLLAGLLNELYRLHYNQACPSYLRCETVQCIGLIAHGHKVRPSRSPSHFGPAMSQVHKVRPHETRGRHCRCHLKSIKRRPECDLTHTDTVHMQPGHRPETTEVRHRRIPLGYGKRPPGTQIQRSKTQGCTCSSDRATTSSAIQTECLLAAVKACTAPGTQGIV